MDREFFDMVRFKNKQIVLPEPIKVESELRKSTIRKNAVIRFVIFILMIGVLIFGIKIGIEYTVALVKNEPHKSFGYILYEFHEYQESHK